MVWSVVYIIWETTTFERGMALTRLNLNKFSLNAIKMKSQNDLLSDMMERILQGNCKLEFRKTVNVCSENYYNLTVLSYDQFEDLVSHFSSSPPFTAIFTAISTRKTTGLLLTKLRTWLFYFVWFYWYKGFSNCCPKKF